MCGQQLTSNTVERKILAGKSKFWQEKHWRMLDPVVLAGVNFGESYVVEYISHIANLSQWKSFED